MSKYICKIATVDEVSKKFDYEISVSDDKDNWICWKKEAVARTKKGLTITYMGLLDNEIICECTAALDPKIVQNSEGLIDKETVYLFAFRTIEKYQGEGYFSKLFKYMMEDLKSRGYKKATLGVEPHEEKNKIIYKKYGFTKHIKDANETYPDGTIIKVEYYGKSLI